MKMKGYAMLGIGKTGWIEKDVPACGPLDAIVKPLAVSPCTSDVHTVWEGAIGERHDMILGHEAVGEVVETGELVKDLKVGDKVIVPAITPDWGSLEAQGGYSMHSGGMLAGWKFSNFKDGVFAEYFHVNEADANLARLPEGVDTAAAVMLSDMVPTGFHGAELAKVEYGDSVCVDVYKRQKTNKPKSLSFVRYLLCSCQSSGKKIECMFLNETRGNSTD